MVDGSAAGEVLFGPISKVFELSSPGCWVAVDNDRIAPSAVLRIGDRVVLRYAEGRLVTAVRQIEYIDGATHAVGVLLGDEASRRDVSVGAELWKIE